MEISIIAALSKNNCIGDQGKLPWHFSEDLAYFKKITWGHHIIMGRKTWESIPENLRPLSGRFNHVLTREQKFFFPKNVLVHRSTQGALQHLKHMCVKKLMIIGGVSLFQWALPQAHFLYLTRIHKIFDGDTFFPSVPWEEYTLIQNSPSNNHPGLYDFHIYEKIKKTGFTDLPK